MVDLDQPDLGLRCRARPGVCGRIRVSSASRRAGDSGLPADCAANHRRSGGGVRAALAAAVARTSRSSFRPSRPTDAVATCAAAGPGTSSEGQTMTDTDDKPALKITLEDLAKVTVPQSSVAGMPAAAGAKQYGNIAEPGSEPV